MLRFLLLASAAIVSPPAFADGSDTAAPAGAATATQDHDAPNAEIVVTGTRARANVDVLGGTTVLAKEELTREMRSTIGETLARQPGVSATSFGPNASRPILRGFTGDRARLLVDGIGSIDVSNTSADHAAIINPLTAERIEVLRGPAALMFTPSSVGGVVNVIDARIPRHVPTEPVHVDAIATYGSAADERTVSGAVDVPLAGKIVVHADGSYTKTDDLGIGGHVLSRGLRAQALASAEPETRALADLKGTLPNTATENWEVAGGAALITDGGNLGFSASHYDTFYGVPVRYSLDPAVEAERVRLHAKQDRFDLRGEVEVGGSFLQKIRLRAAAADYQHSEIAEDGTVGTTFFNQGFEGRLELVQKVRGGWDGLIGAEASVRDMHVVGDEKFLPKNSSNRVGLFTLQSLDFGPFRAEAAGRYEHNELTAQADADIGNPRIERRFDSFSASLGGSYALAPGLRFGINVSRSERAPTPEELFANGPHAGTQAYEIGNADFRSEKSWGVEATLKGSGQGWNLSAAGYYTWFDDYIYDTPTGAVRDDLPVFEYRQANARYYGFEVEGSVVLGTVGGFRINADGLADYVHAQIVDGGPVPRIPPLRLMGGLEAQSDQFTGRVEIEHDFAQGRIAAFETRTDAYTMVNASIAWKPWGTQSNTSLVLSANNLFDVEARRHTSVLKDYAPLAGRDIRVTARFQL